MSLANREAFDNRAPGDKFKESGFASRRFAMLRGPSVVVPLLEAGVSPSSFIQRRSASSLLMPISWSAGSLTQNVRQVLAS